MRVLFIASLCLLLVIMCLVVGAAHHHNPTIPQKFIDMGNICYNGLFTKALAREYMLSDGSSLQDVAILDEFDAQSPSGLWLMLTLQAMIRGRLEYIEDGQLAGEAKVVLSWSPNCHDQADILASTMETAVKCCIEVPIPMVSME